MKTFQRSRALGTDGLSEEFYRCFWNDTSSALTECLNHRTLLGEHFVFQRRGFVSLISINKSVIRTLCF